MSTNSIESIVGGSTAAAARPIADAVAAVCIRVPDDEGDDDVIQ